MTEQNSKVFWSSLQNTPLTAVLKFQMSLMTSCPFDLLYQVHTILRHSKKNGYGHFTSS